MRKTICLDFDGVLHSYSSGWKGISNIPDPPVPGAMAWLEMILMASSWDVAIYSSRSRNIFGRRAMKAWLHRHMVQHLKAKDKCLNAETWAGIILDGISWPWFKPSAFVTIDDRALQFNGDWDDPKWFSESLHRFKPWNK